ncbi:hypothetical protein D3C72_753010 [compost metagenome]
MVGEGVVGRVIGAERPDAPAAEHVRRHQPPGRRLGLVGVHDARCQAVARVRGDALELGLLRAEGQRVEIGVWHPEGLVEAPLEVLGLAQEVTPQGLVAQRHEQLAHGLLGGVVVALNLGRGQRVRRVAAVLVDEGLGRVFPALVLGALVAGFGVVLVEAVAVAIAVFVHPLEHGQNLVAQAPCERRVAGHRVVMPDGHQKEPGPGVVPVVARVRGLAEERRGAQLELMDHAARLLVAVVVVLGAELGGDRLDHAPEHRRAQQARLPGGGERVAPEERLVNRDSCGRREPLGALALQERERGQIGDGPIPALLHDGVRRGHRGGMAQPLLAVAVPGRVRLDERVAGMVRRHLRPQEDRVHRDAQLNGLMGHQAQPVDHAAGLEGRPVLHPRKAHHRPVLQLVVAHVERQLAALRRLTPRGGLGALADGAVPARGGANVVVVHAELEVDGHLHGRERVVGDDHVLVQAATHEAVHLNLEALQLDLVAGSPHVGFGRRRQVIRDRGVRVDQVGRHELGRLAADTHHEARQKTRLVVVEPVKLARPHAAVNVRDQHGLALVGDQRLREHPKLVERPPSPRPLRDSPLSTHRHLSPSSLTRHRRGGSP